MPGTYLPLIIAKPGPSAVCDIILNVTTAEAQTTHNFAGTTRRAALSAIFAAGSFSLMFALIKLLGKSYPSGEILFSRSFFALIPLLPMIIKSGGWRQVLRTRKPWAHVTRSAVGLVSAVLCIESLRFLPLAEATSLFYAAPLITTVLAAALLKERVSRPKAMAIVVGFLGVLYMLQPRLSSNIAGAAMALASAFTSAYVMIELRRMGATEKALTIVVYFMLACSVAGVCSMPFGFVVPNAHDAILLLLIGVIGGIAQYFMTEAYHLAPASTVAPLNYISLLWAVLLDVTFWGRMPTPEALAGAVVIALSGIFVIAPERAARPRDY